MKNYDYEKFSMDDAMKIVRGGGYYMMHISWFTPETGYQFGNLEQKSPECAYVLLINEPNIHWRSGSKAIFGLVLGDSDGNDPTNSERYNLD